MAFVYGSPAVTFYEAMEGSQDAALSRNAQVYKAIWKVAWGDVENAKVALLGKTTAKPAAGGLPAYFSRALPHAHPKAPWLFATDIVKTEGREPRGKDAAGVASYKWGFLATSYTKLAAPILPDTDPRVIGTKGVPDESLLARFVRKRRRSVLQYLTNRYGGWRWLDTDRPVPVDLPWRLPRLRVLLTWMNIPIANLNEAYINDSFGTCNQNAFGGFGVESCLLNSVEWPDYFPIPGQDGFQVDVLFDITYFPTIWLNTNPVVGYGNGPNFFPDPQRFNTPQEVGRVVVPGVLGSIVHPFPVRDWAPMFQPINI